MNITLKTFQRTRVRELRETAAAAQMGFQQKTDNLVHSSNRCW